MMPWTKRSFHLLAEPSHTYAQKTLWDLISRVKASRGRRLKKEPDTVTQKIDALISQPAEPSAKKRPGGSLARRKVQIP
jgi:hypothetical protein